ncbi:MAG: hypothetical protein AAB897_00330 [Patescibacteria group bacterium]
MARGKKGFNPESAEAGTFEELESTEKIEEALESNELDEEDEF